MKPKTLILMTLFLAISLNGNIFAQNYTGMNGQRNKLQYKEQLKDKLNLTDEQVAKIEGLKFTHRKQMIDLRADLEKKEVELDELQSTVNFSREAYVNKINEIISAKNKIELAQANHKMDIYQLLDENQKKEWNKMNMMMHEKKHRVMRQMKIINND